MKVKMLILSEPRDVKVLNDVAYIVSILSLVLIYNCFSLICDRKSTSFLECIKCITQMWPVYWS